MRFCFKLRQELSHRTSIIISITYSKTFPFFSVPTKYHIARRKLWSVHSSVQGSDSWKSSPGVSHTPASLIVSDALELIKMIHSFPSLPSKGLSLHNAHLSYPFPFCHTRHSKLLRNSSVFISVWFLNPQDKGLRCIFYIPEQTWPPDFPCISQFLLGIPCPHFWSFLAQRLGLPFPQRFFSI